MPRTIQILPDRVANQIAAGEVVERPASVVKELVENALDARAAAVEVAITGGGKRSIRVADDGVGMVREDALLALDRHATSKIRDASDLEGVTTLGFRGEALPSIAAVSRLTLDTCAREEELGTRVRVDGGRIVSIEDSPRRPGTTVEVKTLFFNAPARAKFLKSARAETRAISEAVIALSLAHPSVAFLLTSDGRELLSAPSARDIPARVAAIWGEEVARTLVAVSGESGRMSVRGLVQRPDQARPGMRRGYLYVNGRPFRDPVLLRAADRGYRTTIASGVRPWVFFYFDAPRGHVDVNVHPAKAEVRFRDLPAVERLVEEAVRQAHGEEESSASFQPRPELPRLEVREPRPARRDSDPTLDAQTALFVPRVAAGATAPPAEPAPEAGRPQLWQVLNTYIVAETRDGLVFIDQHSAHERVLFERLMDLFQKGGEVGQRLLFPLTLRLTGAEYRQVESLSGLLSRTGFEVEGFGGDTVIVHAVPNPHPYFDAERCFREMIAELTEGSELMRSGRNQHERIAMTFACKGAIKAGQRLSATEMEELFDRLFATELPYHDVHGRPTVVRLSAKELKRKFGR
jgi:DNA mismatch repair protein MutL